LLTSCDGQRIRYAQAPTGNLRWQPPHLPAKQNNTPVAQANGFGPICPQALPSVPNVPFIPGNEDCLFLNVYAPPGAQNLPVLVWIHGGGYGYGDGTQDMAEIINANNKGFVAVTIQYRVSHMPAASHRTHTRLFFSLTRRGCSLAHSGSSRRRR
jgi:carboxylesterase type B